MTEDFIVEPPNAIYRNLAVQILNSDIQTARDFGPDSLITQRSNDMMVNLVAFALQYMPAEWQQKMMDDIRDAQADSVPLPPGLRK